MRRTPVKRYLLSGVVTLIPLWVTYLVFDLIFTQLSRFGTPWARALATHIQGVSPDLARWLLEPWLQSVLAAVITLLGLYLLGWAVNRVVGRRIVSLFESTVDRIPGVKRVYGAVKKFLAVLEQRPEGLQRVVLIPFPTPEMKTIGFVTRTLEDPRTGQRLAVVYVPTTPNPTSGYLEIVPYEHLVATDWTVEEAMSFVMSGGTVAPDQVNYGTPSAGPGHAGGDPASVFPEAGRL
jgi:uncharacterized membrane protein